jgi:hypothetical protein
MSGICGLSISCFRPIIASAFSNCAIISLNASHCIQVFGDGMYLKGG